jgi:hypothetical protein
MTPKVERVIEAQRDGLLKLPPPAKKAEAILNTLRAALAEVNEQTNEAKVFVDNSEHGLAEETVTAAREGRALPDGANHVKAIAEMNRPSALLPARAKAVATAEAARNQAIGSVAEEIIVRQLRVELEAIAQLVKVDRPKLRGKTSAATAITNTDTAQAWTVLADTYGHYARLVNVYSTLYEAAGDSRVTVGCSPTTPTRIGTHDEEHPSSETTRNTPRSC